MVRLAPGDGRPVGFVDEAAPGDGCPIIIVAGLVPLLLPPWPIRPVWMDGLSASRPVRSVLAAELYNVVRTALGNGRAAVPHRRGTHCRDGRWGRRGEYGRNDG